MKLTQFKAQSTAILRKHGVKPGAWTFGPTRVKWADKTRGISALINTASHGDVNATFHDGQVTVNLGYGHFIK